jgi:hypothetical protein
LSAQAIKLLGQIRIMGNHRLIDGGASKGAIKYRNTLGPTFACGRLVRLR